MEVRLDAVLSSGRRFVLGQFRDVTDERQQTRELAASEGRYRQLVDNLPDSSVMLFDNDLRLVLAAGEALIASGYEHPHELAGRMITDLLHAASVGTAAAPLCRVPGRALALTSSTTARSSGGSSGFGPGPSPTGTGRRPAA